MNELVKWIKYIIIASALPIIVRLIIRFFLGSESNINWFSLTDILFYGLAIHVALNYDLSSILDETINSICKFISDSFVVFYFACCILSITEVVPIENLRWLPWSIVISIFFCVSCKAGLPWRILKKRIN